MDLLIDPWIPVRDDGGTGEFHLLTLEQLLCTDDSWWVSLTRDDLELACIQLLACMAQVMFLPENDSELRERMRDPLTPKELAEGTEPWKDWFDLDHPTTPFMQTRGVKAEKETSIQKILVGLPEGNNHAFFNAVGEVRRLSGSIAAIALFNQASNTPGFGGGFKDSIRGKAPVTTMIKGRNLRQTIWCNIVTLPRIRARLPGYEPDLGKDRPCWVDAIQAKSPISAHEIGLVRGLFWQPSRVELVHCDDALVCDVLGVEFPTAYTGFLKEKFTFTLEGVWLHPHGAMTATRSRGAVKWRFISFTTNAPAWTWLSEFVVPSPLVDNAREGSTPAAPVTQFNEICPDEPLHLIVGGYRAKQASVTERRHEMFTLAEGWEEDHKGRTKRLVELGKAGRTSLRGKLWYISKGDKDKGMKGIGVPLHETGDKIFYARTESLFHETLREKLTFKQWLTAESDFAMHISEICRSIFKELTDPYAMKPELIPVIAWARRTLNADLANLTGGDKS